MDPYTFVASNQKHLLQSNDRSVSGGSNDLKERRRANGSIGPDRHRVLIKRLNGDTLGGTVIENLPLGYKGGGTSRQKMIEIKTFLNIKAIYRWLPPCLLETKNALGFSFNKQLSL